MPHAKIQLYFSDTELSLPCKYEKKSMIRTFQFFVYLCTNARNFVRSRIVPTVQKTCIFFSFSRIRDSSFWRKDFLVISQGTFWSCRCELSFCWELLFDWWRLLLGQNVQKCKVGECNVTEMRRDQCGFKFAGPKTWLEQMCFHFFREGNMW